MIEKLSRLRTFRYKKLLSYTLQIVIIGLLGWYLYQNRDVLVALRNIRWQHIVWIVVLDVAQFLVVSYINYSMLQRLDPKVGLWDCIMLQYVNNLLNKILPTIGGGAAFRGYYLKKRYDFPYIQFASTIAGLYVISFSSTSLIAIFCLLYIYVHLHVFNWIIFVAYLGILLPTLFIILFSPQIPASENRLLRTLKGVLDSWNIIRKEPRLVLSYLFLSVLLLLLATAYTYVSYVALGVKPGFIPMLYLTTLGIIMAFLNFTPDGIGVKEGFYIFSKELVQIPEDILVLGSLYIRGISIVSSVLIGGISYWLLMRNLKRIGENQIPVVPEQ